MSKKLVAYFSASGVTAGKAKELADKAGADLFAIEPTQAYTREDLDWTNKQSRSTVSRSKKQQTGGESRVALGIILAALVLGLIARAISMGLL